MRRAECERLVTEAESEEEAKRSAAATRDFKEAAARSKAAKDLRESAEVAEREADELEADAARMEAEAEAEDDAGARDGDGEAEESTPADPTEAYKKLKASREEASVETWRARRRRVLAESAVEPEDSPRPSRCVPSPRFSRPGLKGASASWRRTRAEWTSPTEDEGDEIQRRPATPARSLARELQRQRLRLLLLRAELRRGALGRLARRRSRVHHLLQRQLQARARRPVRLFFAGAAGPLDDERDLAAGLARLELGDRLGQRPPPELLVNLRVGGSGGHER